MKLIVDIPYETYKDYMTDRIKTTDVLQAVRQGKPLPKHHGRLIDADELLSANIDTFSQQTELKIKYAPTIIEADKEE